MSDLRVRSRKGCLTCRNKRKKCDESRPTCQRCSTAKIECLGYAHLDDSAPNTRKPRQKPNTPALPESTSKPSRQFSGGSPVPVSPDSISNPNDSISHDTNPPSNTTTASLNPNYTNLSNEFPDILFDSGYSTLIPSTAQEDPALSWKNNLGLAGAPSIYSDKGQTDVLFLYGTPDLQNMASVDLFVPGILSVPKQDPRLPFGTDFPQTAFALLPPTRAIFPASEKRVHLSFPLQYQDEAEDDSDTEGVMSLVGPTITLDRTNDNNSLPFILSSYLRWIKRAFFEPLKASQRKKDYLIQRYMDSDDSRYATTLVAIVIESLDKNPLMALENSPAMRALQSRVSKQFCLIKSNQASPSNSYAYSVLTALRDFQEMMAIQCLFTPLSHVIKVLDDAAPVYRKACSEPPGYPIHLSTQLLHPDYTLRQFPSLDILISFNTGCPMHFRYDTTYSPELCERVVDSDLVGLQWMNGVPNQFLVMLARMNMLLEDSAPNTDPRVVQELEMEIRTFRPVLGDSPDPYLRIARLMGLCGVTSNDPRVEKALKKFVRLLEGVKPGRMPDIFLVLPLLVSRPTSNAIAMSFAGGFWEYVNAPE
ncbi:Fungal Zn(2)-Cys(6) binuclear cluster domain [Ceratobasidium sp. AG-Ba]|nr:Fungal Zn(2)-Cys(6) binuclear cluster domain [Ceratobasidium sp. AG-Ba]QRW07176.1 Fungal Zn(2)-Cys(6) binuclear cluster domain [Ceratobasidium sp. AG-Ba]